jgi:hypothetical protein
LAEGVGILGFWRSQEVEEMLLCCDIIADGKPCLVVDYNHFDEESDCITPILAIITPKGIENLIYPLIILNFL